MRGTQERQEPMFAYIRLEDLVPQNHVLRKIDAVIDFSRIEERTRDLYSSTGRPSIDPEVLIRMMVVGYLNGITSERRLCEEVHLNLAYRWFCGLNLEEKVPNHSTFSKNRHGRFAGTELFREFFYDVVEQAKAAGLVKGKHLSVDASTVNANASKQSLEPVVVSMDPEGYLKELDEQAPEPEQPPVKPPKPPKPPVKGSERSNDIRRSRTDPDARLLKTQRGPSRLCYSHNILMDNSSRVILDVEVSEPNQHQEGQLAGEMVERCRFRLGLEPETVGGDSAYGNGAAVRRLCEAGVRPHVSDGKRRHTCQEGIFGSECFTYDEQASVMICPAGKRMRLQHSNPKKRLDQYIARKSDCEACSLREQCTRGRQRSLKRHWDEAYLDYAQQLRGTHGYELSQRCRKKIEHLFGEAKEQMGLRRAQRRRREQMLEQSLMTATVQNIKRILKAHGPSQLEQTMAKEAHSRHLGALAKAYATLLRAICRAIKSTLLIHSLSRTQGLPTASSQT